jgi:hypothetical protein
MELVSAIPIFNSAARAVSGPQIMVKAIKALITNLDMKTSR